MCWTQAAAEEQLRFHAAGSEAAGRLGFGLQAGLQAQRPDARPPFCLTGAAAQILHSRNLTITQLLHAYLAQQMMQNRF